MSPQEKPQISPRRITFPKIADRQRLKSMNKQRVRENEIGVFNKYEYLTNKTKSPSNKIIPYNVTGIKEKEMENIRTQLIKDDKMNTNDDEVNLDVVLNYDFENTTNENFLNLNNKIEQLEKMNKNILKNIKENEKIYEKKLKEAEKNIELNKNKLKALQEENELIKLEISDLEKLLQLNEEENKIKVEVKIEESKFIKENNNVSQTRNEILQDLKILKSEEEKIQRSGHTQENQVISEKYKEKEVPNEDKDISETDKNVEDSNVEHDVNLSLLKKKYNIKDKENSSFNNLKLENTSNLILNNIDI